MNFQELPTLISRTNMSTLLDIITLYRVPTQMTESKFRTFSAP